MKKYIVGLSVSLVAVSFGLVAFAQVTQTATLTLSPSSTSVNVNNTFTVNITLNTGGQAAYGVDINRIHFNPSILQVVDSDGTTAGVQIAPGVIMPVTVVNTVDNVGGTIQFSQLANPSSTYNGSGTLATITFRAIAAGTSNVTFDFASGSGTDTNVAGLGGDLLASVGSGSYTGTSLDVTPPVISSILSSGVTQTAATITWTTNENADTQVDYGLTSAYGNSTALNSTLATSHSASLSSLLPGTVYHYRVKSRDAAGNLSQSSDQTFTTTDTTAPTAPGTPILTVISDTRIDLSWTASTDNVAVSGYKVERCSGSATCSTYAQISAPASNSYSDTGLTASTIYRYRVRAVDAAGNNSSYSTAANATTQAPPDITPPTISAVALSGITTSGATITWTTNENADTQVDYGATASYGLSTTLNSSLVTSHSATLSGLSAGTSYHYRVKSRDAAGNLSQSSDNVLTTQTLPDTTAPSVPTGLSATPASSTAVQISWTASTDSPGAGQAVSGLSGYQVFRGGVLVTTVPSTAYLDSNLSPGNSYSYQVAAVDVAGNVSSKTTSVVATTPLVSLPVQRKIVLSLEGTPTNQKNVSGTVEFIDPVGGSTVYQASITTDTIGQVTITVPGGLAPVVTFRPVITGYLSKSLTGVDLTNPATLTINLPTLSAGDFNNDNLINSLDFSYMNGKWGAPDSLADINRDGTVNSLDFAYVSNNWLLTGQ